MPAEHMRSEGPSQGYFCMRCGEICNMYGTGHGLLRSGINACPDNPELVGKLMLLNKCANGMLPPNGTQQRHYE